MALSAAQKRKLVAEAKRHNRERRKKGRPTRSTNINQIIARRKKSSAKKRAAARRKSSAAKKKKASNAYPSSLESDWIKRLSSESNLRAKEQFLPAHQQIARANKRIRDELARDVSAQTHFGQKGTERLQDVNEWLDQVLQRQAGVTGDIYDKASSNIQSGYAGALSANQKASDQVLGGLQGSAEQLGLGAALDTPTSRLKGEILAAQANVESEAAAANENIQTLGASEAARSQDVVGTAARQGAQDIADLNTQVAGGIAGVTRQARQQEGENLQQRVDLYGQQGLASRNIFNELRYETLDRQRQKWMDKLYADVQRNTMKLQNSQLQLERQAQGFNQKIAKGQLNLQRNELSFNKKLALQQLRNEQAALQAEISIANSPLERERKRLELKRVQADINLVNAQTASALAKGKKKKLSSRLAKGMSKSWAASSARFAGRYS